MTKEQEDRISELFKIELKKQYLRGVKAGMLVVSEVVKEKLNDRSKSLLQRINDVKSYCNVATENRNLFNDQPQEDDKEASS